MRCCFYLLGIRAVTFWSSGVSVVPSSKRLRRIEPFPNLGSSKLEPEMTTEGTGNTTPASKDLGGLGWPESKYPKPLPSKDFYFKAFEPKQRPYYLYKAFGLFRCYGRAPKLRKSKERHGLQHCRALNFHRYLGSSGG